MSDTFLRFERIEIEGDMPLTIDYPGRPVLTSGPLTLTAWLKKATFFDAQKKQFVSLGAALSILRDIVFDRPTMLVVTAFDASGKREDIEIVCRSITGSVDEEGVEALTVVGDQVSGSAQQPVVRTGEISIFDRETNEWEPIGKVVGSVGISKKKPNKQIPPHRKLILE